MSSIILVFTTDVWHTHDSKQLIGVYTDEDELFRQLKERGDFSDWDLEFLKEKKQTQGDGECERDFELIIEHWDDDSLNTLHYD